MNKFFNGLKIAHDISDVLIVLIFFFTTWIKEPKDINYLEWIAVILCFILLRRNKK